MVPYVATLRRRSKTSGLHPDAQSAIRLVRAGFIAPRVKHSVFRALSLKRKRLIGHKSATCCVASNIGVAEPNRGAVSFADENERLYKGDNNLKECN